MNAKEYLNNLLALCTDSQKDIFNRMYPTGPDPKQVEWATVQLENTLKNLNVTKEDLATAKREHTVEVSELKKQISVLERLVDEVKTEAAYVENRLIRTANPINMENADVQEKLALLEALENYGVDNWQGYEDAIDSLKGK